MHNKLYISICGPMGSGKTALARVLSSRLGFTPILEDLTANLYLEDYYTIDMPRWGYHTVTAFLIQSLTIQDDIAQRVLHEGICQDWYVGERYGIYGAHLYEQGILSNRERQTCEELHGYLMKHAVKPDILVILTADYPTLRTRIAQRMRRGEPAVSQQYIEGLQARYSRWADSLDIPSVRFDTGMLDFVTDPDVIEEIIRAIDATLP